MIRCPYCGVTLPDGSVFCGHCGGRMAAQAPVQPQVPVQPQPAVAYPVQYAQTPVQPVPQPTVSAEEAKEFVETTRRLLRWEAKAWKITGIVGIILAAVYAGLFFLCALILLAEDPGYGEFVTMGGMFIGYAIYFLILLLPIGIISLKSAEKISYYLNTIDQDLRPTVKRCGSIGMLVFTAIFNGVHLVFFIINFVRMKTNKKLIQAITGQPD